MKMVCTVIMESFYAILQILSTKYKFIGFWNILKIVSTAPRDMTVVR